MKKLLQQPSALAMIAVCSLLVSGLAPYDRMVWLLEVFPILIGLPVLLCTYGHFRFTNLVYLLLLIHAIILMIGGHYSYARVPAGLWFQDLFHLSRNHFDRLGHLAQGFIPAMVTREILLRRSPLVAGKWLSGIVLAICLAISASYEFIEWWVALLGGYQAEEFLATQGDVWDTQWDMFLALVGAAIALLTLSRYHDHQLQKHDYR
ncbi:MAG: DUF2238 domain-containing protein [Deltaproteobacteria bacterium]|nr:DUF2238 domain-containing protein [Candidatus Anaeroferrophillus wilburensis]MBN2887943.1 DUF2238 domain-containing protein [Deltaproteobacteria bacterium]